MTFAQLPKNANLYICNALMHVRPVLAIEKRKFPRSLPKEDLLRQAIAQSLQGNQ